MKCFLKLILFCAGRVAQPFEFFAKAGAFWRVVQTVEFAAGPPLHFL
jgi:hypothetical protein